jgi:hypothetical protein
MTQGPPTQILGSDHYTPNVPSQCLLGGGMNLPIELETGGGPSMSAHETEDEFGGNLGTMLE